MIYDTLVEKVRRISKNISRANFSKHGVRNYGIAFALCGLAALYFGLTNISKRKELEELKANPPPVVKTVPKADYEAMQARKKSLEDSIAKSNETIMEAALEDFKKSPVDFYEAENERLQKKLDEMNDEFDDGWNNEGIAKEIIDVLAADPNSKPNLKDRGKKYNEEEMKETALDVATRFFLGEVTALEKKDGSPLEVSGEVKMAVLYAKLDIGPVDESTIPFASYPGSQKLMRLPGKPNPELADRMLDEELKKAEGLDASERDSNYMEIAVAQTAIGLHEKAIQTAEKIDALILQSQTYARMMSILRLDGKIQESYGLFKIMDDHIKKKKPEKVEYDASMVFLIPETYKLVKLRDDESSVKFVEFAPKMIRNASKMKGIMPLFDYSLAIAYAKMDQHKKAMEIADGIKDEEWNKKTHLNIALEHSYSGNVEDAKKAAEKISSEGDKAFAYANIARCLERKGEHEEAHNIAEKAREMAKMQDDELFRNAVFKKLIPIYHRIKQEQNPEKPKKIIFGPKPTKKSLDEKLRNKGEKDLADKVKKYASNDENQNADIYSGDIVESLIEKKLYDECMEFAEVVAKVDESSNLGYLYHKMALSHAKNEKYKKAKSVANMTPRKEIYYRIQTLRYIAEIEAQNGKKEQAKQTLRDTFQYLSKNDNPGQEEISGNLDKAYMNIIESQIKLGFFDDARKTVLGIKDDTWIAVETSKIEKAANGPITLPTSAD